MHRLRRFGARMLVGAVALLTVLGAMVFTLGAGAGQVAASQTLGQQAAPAHTPGTPDPTRTMHPPEATRTPGDPGATCTVPVHTPEPTRTMHPPPPTRTPCTNCTPEPTRTLPPPVGTGTPPPHPTRTPHALAIVPPFQFGRVAAGETITYNQVLLNRFAQSETVDLSANSLGGWTVGVVPSQVQTQPGISDTLTVNVTAPVSPTFRIDIERVTASGGGANAAAYLLTRVGRHPYTDLAETDWADDSVQFLTAQGVVGGYNDGSFRPGANVTRAQFAKMLVTALGWALQTPATPTFSDVPASFWGYSYIETAAAHGVISGYNDGSFHPGDSITRAQLAKMVVTARSWSLDTMPNHAFTDVHAQDWFYSYVQLANAAQTMSGYTDGSFHPGAFATRAQVAKILTTSLFSSPDSP